MRSFLVDFLNGSSRPALRQENCSGNIGHTLVLAGTFTLHGVRTCVSREFVTKVDICTWGATLKVVRGVGSKVKVAATAADR